MNDDQWIICVMEIPLKINSIDEDEWFNIYTGNHSTWTKSFSSTLINLTFHYKVKSNKNNPKWLIVVIGDNWETLGLMEATVLDVKGSIKNPMFCEIDGSQNKIYLNLCKWFKKKLNEVQN